MKKLDRINRANSILLDVTPAVFDCGELCDKLCCKGDGEIWLLPGEEELFRGKDGFEVKDYGDGDINLICSTECSCFRNIRPFYCRIFPVFPNITKDKSGEISVDLRFDPRAIRCPLATSYGVTKRFLRHVRLAAKVLSRDEEIFRHFEECGEFLREMDDFGKRLFKERK